MKYKDERGAIMIEATWCVILVMIVFMFLMSFGFLLYQKTMVQIVANEVAEEISQTYKYTAAADSSSVKKSDVAGMPMYRYLLKADDFLEANEAKLQRLTATRLKKTNLAKEEGNLSVTVERIADDLGRFHLEITVEQKYGFLLGDFLRFIGQEEKQTMKSTVYVAGTDVSSYMNWIRTTKTMVSVLTSGSLGKTLESAISAIKNVVSIFS